MCLSINSNIPKIRGSFQDPYAEALEIIHSLLIGKGILQGNTYCMVRTQRNMEMQNPTLGLPPGSYVTPKQATGFKHATVFPPSKQENYRFFFIKFLMWIK